MTNSPSRALLASAALLVSTAATAIAEDAGPAAKPVFTTVYRFLGGANARWPRGGVVVDGAGNIYGTTLYDGACATCGVIYKLAPPAKGRTAWTYTVLHKFSSTWKEGIGPQAPLTLHKNMLYGTAAGGGDLTCGCGTVWRMALNGTGFKVLHTFTRPSTATGSTPIGGLVFDSSDNMYGTTDAGGKHNSGVLYRISASGSFTKLHDFSGDANGGPQGELIFGKDGAIYGTQFGGGKFNQGGVFRMTRTGTYSVLYNFKGVNQPGGSSDGANPEGRLVLGSDGTIYGTTTFGGTPSGYGTAWSIKLSGGQWVYKQIHIFTKENALEANLPHSGFIAGPGGSFYGTGAGGGAYQSGALYQLTPPATAGGKWSYKTLHSFKGRDPNGDTPYADITRLAGTIYGTDLSGGHITASGECNNGCGTIFTYAP